MDSNALSDMFEQASTHFANARPLIPMYIHLILSALFPIFAGAHASLSRPSSAARPTKKSKKEEDSDDEDEDEDTVQKMEGLSNKDAIILPVTAAIVLAGLYFLIMTYGADLINLIMGWYFSGVGVYSVTKLVNDGIEVLLGFTFPSYFTRSGSVWKVRSADRKAVLIDGRRDTSDIIMPYLVHVPYPEQKTISKLWSIRDHCKRKYTVKTYLQTIFDIRANLTIVNVLSAGIGLGTIVYVNTVSKPWFLTNLQGFAVSYAALQLMSPTTFNTGSLILGALFCYDIWAVFFTPLMVTVAKNLDQPIKLVFPRPDEPGKTPDSPPVKSFSMLGLGDIVLPGIMIGLALRFDLYMFYLRKQSKAQKSIVGSDGKKTTQEVIEKAPYVSARGYWGERFWTYASPARMLPPQLQSAFPKPYFAASMIGYVVGMLATLGVMSVFQHAQPALLYLVPGVLISLWGTALVKGELKQMSEFTEAVTGDQLNDGEDNDAKEDDKESSQSEQSGKGLFERLWQEIWSDEEPKKTSQENPEESAKMQKQKDDKLKKANDTNGAIFSFSVSRYDPSASRKQKSDKSEMAEKKALSPTGSETSDDAVVVSSADLDEGEESGSRPRYRTRAAAAEKRA